MNYLAILLAAVASFVIGFIWYMTLFGKVWQRLMGKTEGDKPKGMAMTMLMNFISILAMAFVFAVLVPLVGVINMDGYLKLAVMLWGGLIAPVMINNQLFGGKSWKLFPIDGGYQLLSMLTIAAVLSLMK